MNNVIILIPAYNPDDNLLKLLDKLHYRTIIVDDGSNSKEIFNKIKKKYKVLTHVINLGKGAALKTGLKYINENLVYDGIITVDADGQHDIDDINNIASLLNDKILLGTRNFRDKSVPFKSRIGNLITAKLFKKLNKIYINDTQTGLRGIPKKYVKELIDIKGNRFEYEMNLLIYIVKNNLSFKEIPIKTIYIDNNKHSNFKIIKDSIKIYKNMFKNSK